MERQTKTVKTSNHEVEVKTYLTRGENQAIQNVMLKEMSIKVEGKNEATPEISGDVTGKMEDKTLETVIVNLDGTPENILGRINDMRQDEAEEIIEAVNNVTNGLDDEKKEK